ncbi:hypothetical protein [Mammaliicoccus fleurettii]|uniref:hypothetical protein n=1 Tax=Mammaliicoccus fleurettii TaxID=150056 RepID=UPI0009941267|nr:hypothetical protein [Mammaliicoccus fleurettii]OOV78881.1 hypothetical protein B2G86_00715 [Mammaliicoccus fleurettii]
MEFKAGDRVHVLRLDGEKVDFYATLKDVGDNIFDLIDCSDSHYDDIGISKETDEDFGINKLDYYRPLIKLSEEQQIKKLSKLGKRLFNQLEQEDTEPPEVQYIESENKVELDNHYIVEVKKGLYVEEVGSNNHFKFTKDIKKAHVYNYKESNIRHAELVDGRIVPIKRHIEV